jgi:hypothetical protein
MTTLVRIADRVGAKLPHVGDLVAREIATTTTDLGAPIAAGSKR